MSAGSSPDQAAAAAAFHRVTIEIWTLFSVGFAATILRTYGRTMTVGWKGLQPDDYLVWVVIIFYAAQSALGYSVGNFAQGLANNAMSDEERASLSHDDPEYNMRVVGSKIQIAGWSVYSALIWTVKLSMLTFYVRLTDGLGRRCRVPIYIGFALVVGTFAAAAATIFLSCRPFYKNWQINPDPGNACHPAVSLPVVWVSFAANITTDIYLILIPLPMLWQSTLRTVKKFAATIVLGAGIFVLVCATLKSVFVLVDPVNGAQLAGSWGIREAFTAVVVANLPMIFSLLQSWLKPFIGTTSKPSQKKGPFYQSGFQTIGGHGDEQHSQCHRGLPVTNTITVNSPFSESKERMMDDIKMQSFEPIERFDSGGPHPGSAVVVCNSLSDLTHEQRDSTSGDQRTSRARENWWERESGSGNDQKIVGPFA